MKDVKRVLAGLMLAATLSAGAAAQTPGRDLPRTGVDQRVELMAVIFRLAGDREYNQGKLQPYVSEIDRHFGPRK